MHWKSMKARTFILFLPYCEHKNKEKKKIFPLPLFPYACFYVKLIQNVEWMFTLINAAFARIFLWC